MTTHKQARKPNFWVVTLGLFLLIGLIAGGTYALNEAGFIRAGATAEGRIPPDFPTGVDSESSAAVLTGERPSRPERSGGDRSNVAILGFAKAIIQMAIVITLVYYGQKLLSRLEKRLRRPKVTKRAV